MKYLIIPAILFITVFGCLAIFNILDDPLGNISDVGCVVVSFVPGGDYWQPVPGTVLKARHTIKGSIWVILESHQTISSDNPVGSSDCKPGTKASASIRVGRITHKVIKVIYVVCSGIPAE